MRLICAILLILINSTASAEFKVSYSDVVSVWRLQTPTAEGYDLLVRSLMYVDQPYRGNFYFAKSAGNLIGSTRSLYFDSNMRLGAFNPERKFYEEYTLGKPMRSGRYVRLKHENSDLEFSQIDGELPLLKGTLAGQKVDTELLEITRLIPLVDGVEAYELINHRRAIEVNGHLADTIAIFHFGFNTSAVSAFSDGSTQGGFITSHRVNVVFGKKTPDGILPLVVKEGVRAMDGSIVSILANSMREQKPIMKLNPSDLTLRLPSDANRFYLRLEKMKTGQNIPADSIYGFRYELSGSTKQRYSSKDFKIDFVERKRTCESEAS